MSLYAVDAVDDAFEATRAFLWPLDLRRWAKLALVVLFVGGTGFNPLGFGGNATSNVGSGPSSGPGGPGGPESAPTPVSSPGEALPALGGPELAVVAAVVAVVVAVVLLFALVGAVMEFVLVESLRRETVQVRRYWGDHWRRGLSLFAFRLVVGVVTLGAVALLLLVAVGPLLLGIPAGSLLVAVVAVPLLVVVAVVGGLVNGFTTVFVVPVMLVEECGLRAGWRRFWPTLTAHWKQYAVYAVLGFVLQFAVGVLTGLGTLLAAVAVGVPLALVGVAGAALASVAGPVGWALVALAVVLFVLALVAVALLLGVPAKTYLRYYALFVLGDTNDAFDPIPERRRQTRATE